MKTEARQCNPGERYGFLTVIERDYEEEQRRKEEKRSFHKRYLCKCDCGNLTSVDMYDLQRGNTTSCGCAKRLRKRKTAIEDLTGMSFGSLKVVGMDIDAAFGGGVHKKWICECGECGSLKSIRGSDLRAGKTDCGCLASKKIGDKKANDLTGRVFGRVIVLKRDWSVEQKSGRHASWICSCLDCGSTESFNVNTLTSGFNVRCNRCSVRSAGEQKIAKLLDEAGYDFVYDKPYRDWKFNKSGRPPRFDFCVTGVYGDYMIEFDGIHHYVDTYFGYGRYYSAEENQIRDDEKNEMCRRNGVGLIRIPYTHINDINTEDLVLETSRFRVV